MHYTCWSHNIRLTRRGFLVLGSAATASIITGCATNPVTGESQLMMISEQQEIALDKKNSPHQFSADYGVVSDVRLNSYINATGLKLASLSHRPHMPYSFQGVNATYVNAYAFPGGSIAITRGILLAMQTEAELAALLGHEIGHVNARHTASRMSKGMLTKLAVIGVTAYAGSQDRNLGSAAYVLGGIGAGLLLASYSRADERMADELGMEYMVRAGHNPSGMVGLMDRLRAKSRRNPSALGIMFSTHPMSEERYQTAIRRAAQKYPDSASRTVYKERYMDKTAKLRSIKGAIEHMQKGEKSMGKKRYPEAEGHFSTALKQTPNDYAGLLLMSKCQMMMGKNKRAKYYADKAANINPTEPQAKQISGVLSFQSGSYKSAYSQFASYEKLLPGNPSTIFFRGMSQEKMGNRRGAAKEYYRYLQKDNRSQQARYAYDRLVKWGYIKPKEKR